MSLAKTVSAWMSHHHPPWVIESGVVGVSGGADSVALTRLLLEAGAKFTIAHINHRLRGIESDGDQRFVADLAMQLGVDVECRCCPVSAEGNLEANARSLRYVAFIDIAKSRGATWIATGHTADDQAETVLFRLLRGTGLTGLRGIVPKRMLGEIALLRPLLHAKRSELLAFLAERDQNYRTDSTNADFAFSRNRIRHELLPMLRDFRPSVDAHLVQLAEQAAEWNEMIDGQTSYLLGDVELARADRSVVLSGTKIDGFDEPTTSRILRMIWQREGWPLGRMSREHWQRAAKAAQIEGSPVQFPGNVRVRRIGPAVQLWCESSLLPAREELGDEGS